MFLRYAHRILPKFSEICFRRIKSRWIPIVLFVPCLFLIIEFLRPSNDAFILDEFDVKKCNDISPTNSESRWIVLTSIIHPTHDVVTLSKMSEYSVVVVGDEKTPKNWSCPGVVFLSLETQKKMGYGIVKVLPNNNYARKMIGYLYAIENGATVIHETDDDNSPFDDLKAFNLDHPFEGLQVHSEPGPYNHFPHFGQVSAWPRGYPITELHRNQPRAYTKVSIVAPAIRNGAVNQDPDVDAIFRLTRKHSKEALNISFDEKAPPIVVPYRSIAPYNTQTTTFLKHGFWSLYLPASVNFRAMDIWRSYWAQPLLWLIKQKLVFVQITAKQVPHRVRSLAEFRGERVLYEYANMYVRTVLNWRCPFDNFEKCAIDLAEEIHRIGLWTRSDITFLKIWFNDLKKLCYKMPEMADVETDFLPLGKEPITFFPVEQKTVMAHVKHPVYVPQ